MWHSLALHKPCALACRCHWRLLDSSEAKELDHAFMEQHPADWKANILPLVSTDGKRDKACVKGHLANLTHIKRFTETSEKSGKRLLTKTRFKKFMTFWEGYGSESGSDSFMIRSQKGQALGSWALRP